MLRALFTLALGPFLWGLEVKKVFIVITIWNEKQCNWYFTITYSLIVSVLLGAVSSILAVVKLLVTAVDFIPVLLPGEDVVERLLQEGKAVRGLKYL